MVVLGTVSFLASQPPPADPDRKTALADHAIVGGMAPAPRTDLSAALPAMLGVPELMYAHRIAHPLQGGRGAPQIDHHAYHSRMGQTLHHPGQAKDEQHSGQRDREHEARQLKPDDAKDAPQHEHADDLQQDAQLDPVGCNAAVGP